MKMNFARLTAQVARAFGDREALVNVERGRRYTARELHLLSNRIVNMMRDRLQLRRGDRYLCILENDNLSLLHAWTALKGEAAAALCASGVVVGRRTSPGAGGPVEVAKQLQRYQVQLDATQTRLGEL